MEDLRMVADSASPLMERPDSPCVAICATLYDDACRGWRTYIEVANWVLMTPEEKEVVWARIEREGILVEENKSLPSYHDLHVTPCRHSAQVHLRPRYGHLHPMWWMGALAPCQHLRRTRAPRWRVLRP